MSADVLGKVASIGPVFFTVIGRRWLLHNPCAGLPSSIAVRVNVVDINHHVLCIRSADGLRALAKGISRSRVLFWPADHDEAIAEQEFGVQNAAILSLDPQTDLEPERFAEPVDRFAGVFVPDA